MISAGSFQAIPATVTFVAGPHWEQYTFTFEQFGLSEVECLDVRFVAFVAGPKPGSFASISIMWPFSPEAGTTHSK